MNGNAELFSPHEGDDPRPMTLAQIAVAIPALSPDLKAAVSEHRVFHGRKMSAAEALADRRSRPPSDFDRADTDLLVQRAIYIGSLLDGPADYLDYYTSDEVIKAGEALFVAQQRWPEADYIATLRYEITPIAHRQKYYAERDSDGYYDYKEETPRAGELIYGTSYAEDQAAPFPAWDDYEDEVPLPESTSDLTVRASEVMRQFMLAGLTKNIHRHKYLLNLKRPSRDRIEATQLRNVQQMLADKFALEVIGQRQSQTGESFRAGCLSNVAVIEAWYEANKTVLNLMPDDFKHEPPHRAVRSRLDYLTRDMSAQEEVRFLISVMKARITSGESDGTFKHLDADLRGFYMLQRRIAATVDRIKKQLHDYTPPPELNVTPIIPLE